MLSTEKAGLGGFMGVGALLSLFQDPSAFADVIPAGLTYAAALSEAQSILGIGIVTALIVLVIAMAISRKGVRWLKGAFRSL